MHEATAHAPAPARLPSTADAKRKVGRPSGKATSAPAPAPADDAVAVPLSPDRLAILAEWAAVKGTTPDALVRGAVDRLLAHVAACVEAYRVERAEFDRTTAARIEAMQQQ